MSEILGQIGVGESVSYCLIAENSQLEAPTRWKHLQIAVDYCCYNNVYDCDSQQRKAI